jgi:hypothetical protein
MSAFPGSSKVQKGSFLIYDQTAPEGKTIVFQYNPDTIVYRIHQPPGKSMEGAAQESIQITLEFDASDALEETEPNDLATQNGLHPILSALRLLLEEEPGQNRSLFDRLLGIQRRSNQDRLILFTWGNTKVVPVRVTSITITEEAFDTKLNPLRARVELSMKVLTASDVSQNDLGYQFLSEYRQLVKDLAERAYKEL